MWISSQDKKHLLNVNNFSVSTSNGFPVVITTEGCYQEGEYMVLGTYETEERTKEVLYQIRRQIENKISSDTVFKGVRTVSETVFQMPRE